MSRLLAPAALPLLAGCYLVTQAAGQLSMLASMEPVHVVRSDPGRPDRVRRALRLVEEIRDFGVRELGLRAGSSYTHYFDTRGMPVTHVVSACRRDRFEPYTWWFPIVGTVPYKGFFDRADAEAEAAGLRAQGYDVHVGGAAAYSTLGWLPDPVLSTMVDLAEEDLAALILHELTHNTVWIPGDVDLNEGLASFVGGQGALEFARRRQGSGSLAYERAVGALASEEVRDRRGRDLYERLRALYASGGPASRVLEERERIFRDWSGEGRDEAAGIRDRAALFEDEDPLALGAAGPCGWAALLAAPARSAEGSALRARIGMLRPPAGPVNNAVILQMRRYGRGDEFRALFESVEGDWPRFFAEVGRRARG